MGRVADALAKIRTPEVLEAQASQMAKMTQAGSAAAADASAQSAQVFKEPFFKVLKGEGPLSNYAWFRNYHAKYFVPGRLAPLTHICLFLGCLGYSMEYAYHLQYERHGVRDSHGH